MKESTSYRFDEITVDSADFKVWRAGTPVELEPKSFKVLLYLIENRNRVVSKDELIEKVWAGTAVTDNALTRVVAQLRRELHDDARRPRYIETVPTVGYRFVASPDAETAAEAIAPSRAKRLPPVLLLLVPVAIFAILLWVSKWAELERRQGADSAAKIAQFTTSLGLDLHPSFSPDGRSIAYSSDRSGRFEVYVQPLANGARELQITSDGQQNLEPVWSPDGQYLAYTSQVRKGIFVVPALGGTPQRLTDFGSQPAWAPDGDQIAFRSEGVYSLVPIDFAPSATTNIWVVSAQGGPPREVTQLNNPKGAHSFPSWHPDGMSILFSNQTLDGTEIWSARLREGSVTRIPNDKGPPFAPFYSPDGRSILYSVGSATGVSVWRQSLHNGRAAEILQLGMVFPRDIAVDRTGRRIAYGTGSMLSNLYTIDANGGEAKPFVTDRSFRNTLPAFSPDGGSVAYLARRSGRPGAVWVVPAAGGTPRRLTPKDTIEWLAGWADDVSVAYGTPEKEMLKFFATSILDGTERPLFEVRRGSPFMRLSPDHLELAYHAETGNTTNIWKHVLKTGTDIQLTFDRDSMAFPVWSPDGKWIAFQMRRGEDSFLSIMDRDGGRATQLTTERGHAWPHGWSPDGDKIAFAALRDGAWNVYWISRTTREQRKLTNYSSLGAFVRYPAWSPRTGSIVFEYAETKGNIYIADLPR